MSAPLTPIAPCVAEHAEPAPGHTRFHVTVIEWLSYDIQIDAPDIMAAEALAQTVWDDEGTEPFRFRDSGLDGIHVDEERPTRFVSYVEDSKAARHD